MLSYSDRPMFLLPFDGCFIQVDTRAGISRNSRWCFLPYHFYFFIFTRVRPVVGIMNMRRATMTSDPSQP